MNNIYIYLFIYLFIFIYFLFKVLYDSPMVNCYWNVHLFFEQTGVYWTDYYKELLLNASQQNGVNSIKINHPLLLLLLSSSSLVVVVCRRRYWLLLLLVGWEVVTVKETDNILQVQTDYRLPPKESL